MNANLLALAAVPSSLSHWITPSIIILSLILSIVFFRPFLQLLGVVIVPENKIGLVTKKFALLGPNTQLPSGRFIALKGEAGFQAQTLAPG